MMKFLREYGLALALVLSGFTGAFYFALAPTCALATPFSYVKYTGNGATTAYAVPFAYIAQADVDVSVAGVPTSAYTWTSPAVITFSAAPANGAVVLFQRSTVQTAPEVTFHGGALRSTDLNSNITQLLYLTQEIDDAATWNVTVPHTEAAGVVFPSSASRANDILGFDGSGNPVPYPIATFAGPTGATGAAGTAGTNGHTILTQSGAPSAGVGSNGDVDIDTTAHSLYGPKAGGAWGSGVSLVGPAGSGSGDMLKANNLSDVSSTSTALGNLGGAPLVSPTLTGTPAAPTASTGTNTTQVATTAYVKANFTATLAAANTWAALQTLSLGLTAPASSFWSTTNLNRVGSRLFAGGATANDGSNSTNLDWLGTLAGAGTLPDDEADYAQGAFLTDNSSTPAAQAVPLIGILAATNSLNSLTASTPRALEALGVNNATGGHNPAVWAFYHECHEVTGTGNCFGDENEVRNIRAAPASNWTPYNLPTGAINLALGCGAGLSATGQFNCPVAEYIEANPKAYTAGLSFLSGSVAAISGISPAVQFPITYALGWYDGTGLLADLYGDASGNVVVIPKAGANLSVGNGTNVNINDGQSFTFGTGNSSIGGSTASNFILFKIGGVEQARIVSGGLAVGSSSVGIYKAQVTGSLNVTGGYSSAGTAGVTCAGVPTASFAVTSGIVTHC